MKNKKFMLIVFLGFMMIFALSTTILTYAYFSSVGYVISNDGTSHIAHIGMKLDLLFDRIDKDQITDNTDLGIIISKNDDGTYNTYKYDSTADWGSATNPYVISNIRHLQNLSILQEIGYFYDLYISKDYDGDNYTNYNGKKEMPYFLVCDASGKPTVIEGGDIEFSPIGSDEYPFIGYVGGAFNKGSGDTVNLATVNGKTSTESVLKDINVVTTTDVTDVGLFGSVKYLGPQQTPDNMLDGTENITGVVSTVRDLVLYDVQISVKNPSWTDKLAHIFSFHKLKGESDNDTQNMQNSVPHENHHIGIAIGHVEYANVENISVYYSDTNTTAIDLSHTAKSNGGTGTTANYMSISGIIGFIDNMNPEFSGSTIGVGTGTSNSDVDATSGGIGSGGGSLSGMGRGYISASSVYNNYTYNYKSDILGQRTYVYCDENYNQYKGILIEKQKNGTYTLETGGTVSFNESTKEITLIYNGETQTTKAFFVKEEDPEQVVVNENVKAYIYYYYDANGNKKTPTTFRIVDLFLRDAEDNEGNTLCTEYIRKRLLWGTESTGLYYFYDGVFTFALSSSEDSIADTWDGDVADNIVLGEDNDSSWTANTKKGNKAIVAYISEVLSNEELDDAITKGKKLMIISKNGDTNNAMTLYFVSTGDSSSRNPGEKYYTLSKVVDFNEDEDLLQSMVESYEAGASLPSDMLEIGEYNNINELKVALESDKVKALNFGSASAGSLSIDEVRNQYNVIPEATGKYKYTYTDGTVTDVEGKTEVQDKYDFPNGYYYYAKDTSSGGIFGLGKTYKRTIGYVDPNGIKSFETEVGGTGQNSVNITRYFKPQLVDNAPVQDVTGAEYLFYCNDSNGNGTYTTIYAPLIYIEDNTFSTVTSSDQNASVKTSKSAALVNSSIGVVSKYVGEKYTYYYMDPNGKYYDPNGVEVTITAKTGANSTTSISNMQLYDARKVSDNSQLSKPGILLYRYPLYNLKNNNKYLQMLSLAYGNNGTFYPIWNGADSERTAANFKTNFGGLWAGDATPTLNYSKDACLIFNNDGSCYIQYNIGDKVEYVGYDGTKFRGANTSENGKLYIYAIEGTQDVDYGRITFNPKDDTAKVELPADEYVLWPENVLSGADISENGFTTDPTYTIKHIGTEEGDINWTNDLGETLSKNDLHKKFTLGNGMAGTTTTITIFNGTLSFGDNSIITAPVGSLGVEADIPVGSIAFRINKDGKNNIRVILAVPISEYYYGESYNPLTYKEDYYFCLWNVSAAGEDWLKQMRVSDAMYAMELPRSNPYSPAGKSPSNNDGIYGVKYDNGDDLTNISKYIKVNYNGTTYRSYLNGDMVLVGYEFEVEKAGVYIMGSTKPLEVIHFSASGTASAGRDGTGGSKLGSIDFVYDYNDKVIVISDESSDSSEEDYNYYYSTLAVLFIKNSNKDANNNYVNVNEFTVKIRREIQDGKSVLIVTRAGPNGEDVEVARYASVADKVIYTDQDNPDSGG